VLAAGGCGISSVPPGEEPPDPPPPISIVGGSGANPDFPDYPGITRTTDAAGNARYVGEVQNQGDRIACNIRVTVNSYERLVPEVNPDDPDAPENFSLLSNPADQNLGFSDLLGESIRYSDFTVATLETCLLPGHRASFDIRNDFPLKVTNTNGDLVDKVAKIEASTTCDGGLYQGCVADPTGPDFSVPPGAIVVSGVITEGEEGVDPDRHLVYTGMIRNQSSVGSATVYHVKIVFTAKDAEGRVVDVGCASIDGGVCPPTGGSTGSPTGLAPGDFWRFTVPMSIVPEQTCPGCFSYIINYKSSP
jgi:hypothetical protein